MSCKTFTVSAMAAAMLLSAAPAAQAQSAACSCGQTLSYSAPAYTNTAYTNTAYTNQAYTNQAYTNAAYANQAYNNGYAYNYGQVYRPVAAAKPVYRQALRQGWVGNGYAGHWHGNTYFGYGAHWGTSVDAQLFAASANGDLTSVKRLFERGAAANSRDAEGLSPLAWAAQYGRVDVARYLLAQKAHINPADKYGFTPLMWAAQEGHTPMVELLLARGANPWVTTRNGVTAHTLARYAGSGASAAALESWFNGRRYTNTLRPSSVRNVVSAAPVRVTAAAIAAPVAAIAAPVVAPPAMALASGGEPNMLQKLGAYKKLAESGARFGEQYANLMKSITGGGFGLNTLSALGDPDVETGKQLTVFYADVARSQDLKAGRVALAKARTSLKADSKFLGFVGEAEGALTEAGF